MIRKSIEHNLKINNYEIQKGDFVRLLNKRGNIEKEGQRFTGKIYLVQEVGSTISTKFSRSHLEARKSVMRYASSSFACSRQTSDCGSTRALKRAETSGGKSDEISNYRLVDSYDFTFFCGILVGFFRDESCGKLQTS